MPLHPQVVSFLEAQSSLRLKPIEDCTPEEFREMIQASISAEDEPEPVESVEDREIPGADGSIVIRIYQPVSRESRGALVYYHGGGWVGGNLDTHDALCRALANVAGCVVVAVDYRLAPEHKYPAAAGDAYASYLWVHNNAEELDIAPEDIAVCGDSAGGNLAAVVCLLARERSQPLPCFQVLIYPIVDCDFSRPSYDMYAAGYSLTAGGMKWFWQHYVAEEAEASEAFASPLLAKSLAGLPPALVLLAEYDVLHDEGEIYAARLQAEGVATQQQMFPGMIHGFLGRVNIFDAAREAIAQIASALQGSFRM